MSTISIQKINTRSEFFPQVFDLREKVLRNPLGLSLYHEDTSGDHEDDIFIAIENEQVIACLMAKDLGKGVLKLRQMAVDGNRQGKGIGKLLMQEAEADAKNRGFNRIELHARQNAIGFYQQLGYTVYGDIFTEVTIPHLAMEKLV
ncbi:MAG: GNAT family N-acetyltransferase [Bacteroidota bacterium]